VIVWATFEEMISAVDGEPLEREPTVQQEANALLSRGRPYLVDVLSILVDNTAPRL
jgi:hypothetical protein